MGPVVSSIKYRIQLVSRPSCRSLLRGPRQPHPVRVGAPVHTLTFAWKQGQQCLLLAGRGGIGHKAMTVS